MAVVGRASPGRFVAWTAPGAVRPGRVDRAAAAPAHHCGWRLLAAHPLDCCWMLSVLGSLRSSERLRLMSAKDAAGSGGGLLLSDFMPRRRSRLCQNQLTRTDAEPRRARPDRASSAIPPGTLRLPCSALRNRWLATPPKLNLNANASVASADWPSKQPSAARGDS